MMTYENTKGGTSIMHWISKCTKNALVTPMSFHKDQIKPRPQIHHIVIPEKGKFIGHTNIACLQIYIGSGILEFFAADRKKFNQDYKMNIILGTTVIAALLISYAKSFDFDSAIGTSVEAASALFQDANADVNWAKLIIKLDNLSKWRFNHFNTKVRD